MLGPVRLPVAVRNSISLFGFVVATVAAALFVALLALDMLGYVANPYIGLLAFVAVPALFVIGLLIIPAGAWWTKRRRRRSPEVEADWPVFDMRDARQRTVFVAVLLLTVANLTIVSLAAYGGLHYMETSEFCGQVCHTTMEPQYAASQAWPHSNVQCVACHVGPGAGALVESKLAGSRRLLAEVTGRVRTPIVLPVEMRPARDKCEQCHWPEKVHGDQLRVIRDYSNNESSTESATALQLHVGNGSREIDMGTGIHWHMHPENQIDYVATDSTLQVIPYVRLTGPAGDVREYVVDGTTDAQVAEGALTRMDCMDCHNRPAHTFSASPERAVDAAIAQGRIPRELPFVRREAVASVGAEYADRDAALDGIARRLEEFYGGQEVGADPRLVARTVTATQDLWSRNVFPAMNVGWGTYPNHLGHVDSPGCFRCHDDEHTTEDGSVISQDCELCHSFQ